MKTILVAIIFTLFSGGMAHAACGSYPEGAIVWNPDGSNRMRYCVGTSWISFNDTSTGTTCAGQTGTIRWNASQTRIEYCDGTYWRQTSNTTNHGTCTSTDQGRFYFGYYPSGMRYYYCTGSQWRLMN